MNSRPRLPIAVLISGTGRTLKNLIELSAAGRLDVEIRLVLSSNPQVRGLEFAEQAGIPKHVSVRDSFDSDAAFGEAIFDLMRAAGVRYVVLAGFMKFLPIPPDFENRVVNIHPALIPAFCGKGYYGERVHREVLKYGAKVSGCTVHFVDNQYDHGPIISQHVVPVQDDDTPESLAGRVFEAELHALPAVLQQLAEDRIRIDGRLIRVDDSAT